MQSVESDNFAAFLKLFDFVNFPLYFIEAADLGFDFCNFPLFIYRICTLSF